jgi:hypothetical protein
MQHPALNIIEDVYSMTLNPELDYFAQLQPLAPGGELANKISTNQVLFKLCMLVDAQAKEIESLKESRRLTYEKMEKLEGRYAETTNQARLDPTNPI